MKKNLCVLTIALLFAVTVSAQSLSKPKQMPVPETDQQKTVLQQGITLHDAKKYDEAIAKYLSVLAENPASTLAMYELSLSYYSKGDKAKAKELAFQGAKYISDHLALFYGTIANILNDEGKPDQAIKIYRDAEDILKNYPEMQGHLSRVNYNLGLTYVRQKKYTEARTELKKAVEHNFSYASAHHLLALVYNGTRYKVPAFLAAARLISLEVSTTRTGEAVTIITDVLKPASKDPKTGNINIFLNLDGAKDEGEFFMLDLVLGTLTTRRDDKEDKDKTDNEMFVDAIDSVIAILEEDKKLGSTFVGKTYIPFMVEMKKKGHVEAFGNMVLYINNNANADAAKWVKANDARLTAFLKWAKEYRAPRK